MSHKRGVKTFEQNEDVQIFLILLNFYFFSPFSIALHKQQKILACFPEDKLSTLIFKFKSFHAPALNAWCFLLEHQWMFEPFLIVESLNCPQCEKMDLNVTQSLLERVQICRRCCKTDGSAEHGGFFWRTAQFNCSEQTRDSWTTIKNSGGSSGNHTLY